MQAVLHITFTEVVDCHLEGERVLGRLPSVSSIAPPIQGCSVAFAEQVVDQPGIKKHRLKQNVS